ncbi:MAG: hypothetical protein U0S36_13085 [Candidatus Nanopelagicales bacterium]
MRGRTTKPPHASGSGTSSGLPVSGKAAASSAYLALSTSREAMTVDCALAHAPRREPYGREEK